MSRISDDCALPTPLMRNVMHEVVSNVILLNAWMGRGRKDQSTIQSSLYPAPNKLKQESEDEMNESMVTRCM